MGVGAHARLPRPLLLQVPPLLHHPRRPPPPSAPSATLGALRQTRADYRAAQEHAALGIEDREPDTVLVLADWQYAGHGHTPGESVLAATIARDLQLNRETAREALQDQREREEVTA